MWRMEERLRRTERGEEGVDKINPEGIRARKYKQAVIFQVLQNYLKLVYVFGRAQFIFQTFLWGIHQDFYQPAI